MLRDNTSKAETAKDSTATIGFEAKLWLTADKLRNNMDAAEYKHVVLGLIFPGADPKIAWGPAARDFGRMKSFRASTTKERSWRTRWRLLQAEKA